VAGAGQSAGIGSDVVRQLVAALPGTAESAHHGHPDFRVGGRIFATLWPAQNRSVLRLPVQDADALAGSYPDTYRLVSARGPIAWLNVDLAQVSAETFRALLEQAWEARRSP
jgi:hypothetical protein